MSEILHIIQILNTSTPTILLVGIIIYLVRYKDRLDLLGKGIEDVKDNLSKMQSRIVWKDTCASVHKDIDRRLAALEEKVM